MGGSRKPFLLSSARPMAPTGESPRLDILELATVLEADISCASQKGQDLISQIEEKTASDLRQAWAAKQRHDVSVYVSLSEKAGIPLALLGTNGVPHVLIGHYLTSDRKRQLQARTNYLNRFDRIIVLCRTQERYLRDEVKLPAERVHFVYDKVDSLFWKEGNQQQAVGNREESEYPAPSIPLLCLSVGRERRDYETLIAAAACLPEMRFVIVASSPWSRGTENTGNRILPGNVTLRKNLSWVELRALYEQAKLVIVPIQVGTEYAAGVNAVLEAMSMAKPLIVSATPGIADYIEDGQTALAVRAGDGEALVSTLRRLAREPELAQTLGQAARQVVDGGRNLDTYVVNLARIIREVAA